MALSDDVSPAVGIMTILQGVSGGSLVSGWGQQISNFITEPDKQLVIRDTGGLPSELAVAVDYPSVQVLIRGKATAGGYTEAYAFAIAVRNALVGIPSRPALWTKLTSVTPRGHIQDLGKDDQARPVFSFNLQLILSFTTSGYRDN